MGFVRFMNTTAGRGARIAAGTAIVIGGLIAGGAVGWVLAVVGLVPVGAGSANVCLLAPFFHAPFRSGPHAV